METEKEPVEFGDTFAPETTIDDEHLMDGKYFLNLVFLQAIRAPHYSLMQGRGTEGLISLQLAADQAARIAIAIGRLKDEDIKKATEDYEKTLTVTDDFIKKTRIANFQLFYILQQFQESSDKKGPIMI
ncbi:MAG: hypothetical protein MUP17_04960 [candidate division Zixibacteria bacterium]|nr:hypothetical protein [candidate division Zixibacteria bacterium]